MLRVVVVAVLMGTLVAGVAQAQPVRPELAQACSNEAHRQSLSGDALTDFMNKCWAGQISVPAAVVSPQSCEEQASLLSGEEKTRFMRECAARK